MKGYDHKKIEKHWQERWQADGLYTTSEDSKKEKCYVLDMFPYPSGEGLHVGHPKGYIATDVFSRHKRMCGYNVLHPMGWDAFGLPAENYAIKNKVHPRVAVEKNIARFKGQLSKIGLDYDWSREINTTDPEYYKWTQWIFIQLFKKGLAYQSDEPINWCPSCQTGLANEDLEDGRCERCGSVVEKKPLRQWVLKITEYAERLLSDLDSLEWPESIKESQRNWIGKSEGAQLTFPLKDGDRQIKVFTTRPDTLFGATYLVVAPEHSLIHELEDKIENIDEVKKHIASAAQKSDIERTAEGKEKTGMELKGVTAINPGNNEEIPVFVADYVLAGYGTGAVMAVPAHDERDFEFAEKFGLPIQCVLDPTPAYVGAEGSSVSLDGASREVEKKIEYIRLGKEVYTGDDLATLINSGKFDGMTTETAKEAITKAVGGELTTTYKLRDWVFSRQRYWGEPIPIIHCEKCGPVAVPEEQLPVVLPEVEHYEPTGTGESPLAGIEEWVATTCPTCGGPGKRETNTMPQWAGSSWYYLRYIDPHNHAMLVDKEKEQYWSPVDMYVGGAEHATRHLIYARFWHKFLYDIGAVQYSEPFQRLQHVGLIQAEDGRKMSKRWGNVINPDDVVTQLGADTLRVYEMFMGPFDQSIAWSTDGTVGARRFLEKVWNVRTELLTEESATHVQTILHQTIKKVGKDIGRFRFNTAISQLMICVNTFSEEKVSHRDFGEFLKLLAPFAPHLAEELWHQLGHKSSIHREPWPEYDEELLTTDEVTVVIQVNGKVRGEVTLPVDAEEEEVVEKALALEGIQKWTGGKKPKRVIYVANKLLNLVV